MFSLRLAWVASVTVLLVGCESFEQREQQAIDYVSTAVDGLNQRAVRQLCEYTTVAGYIRMTDNRPEFTEGLNQMCAARPVDWAAPSP